MMADTPTPSTSSGQAVTRVVVMSLTNGSGDIMVFTDAVIHQRRLSNWLQSESKYRQGADCLFDSATSTPRWLPEAVVAHEDQDGAIWLSREGTREDKTDGKFFTRLDAHGKAVK